MENMRDIYLDQTAITELPFSFGNLIGLERLYLRHCTRPKQLPSSTVLLPKLEVIMAYGSGGLQLFKRYEIQEKVSSEVSFGALYLYPAPISYMDQPHNKLPDISFCGYLNMYCIIRSPGNFIQVCCPLKYPYQLLCAAIGLQSWPSYKTRSWHSGDIVSLNHGSKKSSVSFWFHEKFPEITLCMIGKPGIEIENSVLDVMSCVLVNGAEQLTSWCNYIPTTGVKMVQHLFLCDLRCRLETVISEHEWNHVEISCELKYHRPYGPHSLISECNRIPAGAIKWAGIHVYKEKKSSMKNIQFTNPNITLSQDQRMERDEGK